MNNQQKILLSICGVFIAAYLLGAFKREPKQVVETEKINPMQYPHGISPDDVSHFGGNTPFNSNINVNINASQLTGLANQYMPMFGFVGMVGVQ